MEQSLDFTMTQADIELAQTLRDFLPAQIFDAHLHVYDASFLAGMREKNTRSCSFDQITMADHRAQMLPLLPNVRRLRGNLIPMPDPTMANAQSGARERATDFIVGQLVREPDCVGEVFVRPGDSEALLEAMVARHRNIRGFKCYYYAAGPSYDANETVDRFLPRSAWAVANRHGLAITLHLMRDGLADAENLRYIKDFAPQYPNTTLVLAHCARSFASWMCMDAAREVAPLANVWFDLSAICESAAMFACIRAAGVQRIVWGSDYPICLHRGRSVSMGRSYIWLTGAELTLAYPNGCPATLYAVENLLALRQAAQMLELTKSEIQAIFYDNAVRLFGVAP